MGRVGPTETRPTHDISLTHGSTTVFLRLCDGKGVPDGRAWRKAPAPRTALQIQSGDPAYSTYELPYTPITQKNWSGGRGMAYFDEDNTRYFDAEGVDTRYGSLLLGPKAASGTGYERSESYGGGSASEHEISPYVDISYCSPYTPAADITVRTVQVWLRRGTDPVSAQVSINQDSAGEPGATIAYSAYQDIGSATMALYTFEVSAALTSGTTYWICVASNHFAYVDLGSVPGTTSYYYQTGPGAGYVADADKALRFTVVNTAAERWRFFEYRGQLFAVSNPEDRSAPRLFENLWHGFAADNASDRSKLNTAYNFLANQVAGQYVKIIAGPGSTEDVTWRTITSNTAGPNSSLVCDPPWHITHTTSTEYLILGCEQWNEITGHGLTGPVTDVLVVDDIIYFAQGDSTAIRRGRYNAGAWSWADDGTNMASFLDLINDTAGARQIWKAKASTSTAAKAAVVAWGVNLTFGTDIICGNPQYTITGMIAYGTPQVPWLVKEDSFGSIGDGVFAPVPLSELAAVRSEQNGKALTTFGVYMFFSLLQGFERFYDNRLDDLGPNRDEGLPSGRQGSIVHALPYPGGIVACVDAGSGGYSAILFWNQIGWHELYRGAVSKSITHTFVQVLPGGGVNRLWASEGKEMIYLPICINPRNQSGYQYASSGSLITSTFTGTYREVQKFLGSLTQFTNNLSAGHQTVTVYYQTNNEVSTSTWHAFPAAYDTSPIQDKSFTADDSAYGQRWRLKFALATDDSAKSPEVVAFTMNTVTRIQPKKGWQLTFLLDDAERDIQGAKEPLSADALVAQIEAWADSATTPTPVILHSNYAELDNIKVFVDPVTLTPVEQILRGTQRSIKMIGTMPVYEK